MRQNLFALMEWTFVLRATAIADQSVVTVVKIVFESTI